MKFIKRILPFLLVFSTAVAATPKLSPFTTTSATINTLTTTSAVTFQNDVIVDNEKLVKFREATGNGTNFTALKGANSITTDTTFTLPSADGSTGQVIKTNGSGVLSFVSVVTDPMTTRGDIIYRDASNVTNRLALGTASKVLTSDGTDLTYQFGGYNVAAKSADYTITDTDGFSTINMTTGGTNRTVTLPLAANNTNRTITLKKVDSGTGTAILDGNGSETIDGALTKTAYFQWEWITVQSNGTSWFIQSGDTSRGVYTATLTETDANVNSVTGPHFRFSRVGDSVTVSGRIDSVDANATNAVTFFISLPIASNLTGNDLAGTAVRTHSGNTAHEAGEVTEDSTNDRARVDITITESGGRAGFFIFQYEIK